jgi:hypothetical protein
MARGDGARELVETEGTPIISVTSRAREAILAAFSA